MPMAFIPLAYFFCACFADDMVPHVLALQTIWYHMFAIFISAILLAYFFCACFADDMVPHVCHPHLRYTIGIFFLCLLCRRYGTTCLPYSSPLYYWHIFSLLALQTIWYHMFAILISAVLLAIGVPSRPVLPQTSGWLLLLLTGVSLFMWVALWTIPITEVRVLKLKSQTGVQPHLHNFNDYKSRFSNLQTAQTCEKRCELKKPRWTCWLCSKARIC